MSTAKTSPRLGALLRIATLTMTEQLATWLASSEFADLQPVHSAAIQPLWEHPEGARITSLAKASRVTKQAMSMLVDHLEQRGYVERIPDIHDKRATIVRLTARGKSLAAAVRTCSKRVEEDWAGRIGADRVKELISILSSLRESLNR